MKMIGPMQTAKPRLSDVETCTMVRFWTDTCDKFAARLVSVAALLLKAEETIIETFRGLSTQQAESVQSASAYATIDKYKQHLTLLKANMYILPLHDAQVPQRGAGKQPDALQTFT